MKHNIFYTDGACSGNPGCGGWACVHVIEFTDEDGHPAICTKVESGGKKETTNNEMELTAVYVALVKSYKAKVKQVTIYCDSAYVVNAISKEWLKNWYYNDWKTREGKDIKNQNIWEKMYRLIYEKGMNLTVIKVKGHTGDIFNEIADKVAVKAKYEVMESIKKKSKGKTL